jgi:hypothetical protein
MLCAGVALGAIASPGLAQSPTDGAAPGAAAHAVPAIFDRRLSGEVIVTASRRNLLGVAVTASQGSVTKKALDLRPVFRVGQLYETIPGLVVTVHSGESKANQYQLRGYDLDHGTDFASFVDGMPVNKGTNAHSQGYSDQNFLMPEIVSGLDYTKGPYYAGIGDFGAVGSARVHLLDELPNRVVVSAGTLRDDDAFLGGTYHFDGDDRVWGAVEVAHVDGPWDPPSNFNKLNAAARFSHGDDANGFSLTAMLYQSAGRLETDQSVFAIQQGLIGRFGVLDPTDHGRSARYSLSGHYGATGDHWRFSANAYAINSNFYLVNNFTHFLLDPANGDQEKQDEDRTSVGGDFALALSHAFGSIDSETTIGLQERYDDNDVDRRHVLHGDIVLGYCEAILPVVPGSLPPPPAGTPAGAFNDGGLGQPYAAIGGACNADRVGLNDLGVYIENTAHWTPWLRTVIGFREEDFSATDHSLTTGFRGSQSQTLPQPKASLVLGPWFKSELYLSAGEGFHSNDVRGVFGTVALEGLAPTAGPTPLLAPTTGEEIGVRTNIIPKVSIQVAAFEEDFSSELAFDEDQGQDQPTAPSRRLGVEISGEYRPLDWIEFNTDLSLTRSRYHDPLAVLQNEFQLAGPFIANAPSFSGSVGVLVDNLGPWYGSLQWRDLGPYPVVDGSEFPQDKGYSEVNLDVGYKVTPRVKVTLSIFNLFNAKADAAAFDYQSRLTPTAQPVTGLQVHPLEPVSGRLALSASF